MTSNPPARTWYKSSRSETSKQCVEVYHDTGRVGVRDSADHGEGPELWFPSAAWDDFLASRIWVR
ncbi:DUF397 domain-containing protein [Nocardia sp. NPDC088792]|uniref:DUF397 domain-containing protein n=1 Tax=Nocardia sp. NPDC088792 TaxID=3364332 RepID=UPI00380CE701